MTPTKVLALAVGLALLPVAASATENTPARQALKKYCTGDYMTYCGNLPPGGPEVEACFKANLKKLSPDCTKAITYYKDEQKAGQKGQRHQAEAR